MKISFKAVFFSWHAECFIVFGGLGLNVWEVFLFCKNSSFATSAVRAVFADGKAEFQTFNRFNSSESFLWMKNYLIKSIQLKQIVCSSEIIKVCSVLVLFC